MEEALSHDKHTVGVFKKDGTLVGHVPIEMSRIIDYFMQKNEKKLCRCNKNHEKEKSDWLF